MNIEEGSEEIQIVAKFTYEIGTMRKISRSHRQALLTDDLSDNIAAHSFRVAWISLMLAELEKADIGKVAIMALMHDLGETRTGDQNWLHKGYVTTHDDEVNRAQLSPLPGGESLLKLAREYELRESLEAIIVKDADHLEQILSLKEYEMQGNREATEWLISRRHLNALKTLSALRLGEEIYQQDPSDWWKSIWTDKRRK